MDAKLTLKLNANVIERAKKYASKRKVSLSKVVENQLDLITRDEPSADIKISPFVSSIADGKALNDTRDWQELPLTISIIWTKNIVKLCKKCF